MATASTLLAFLPMLVRLFEARLWLGFLDDRSHCWLESRMISRRFISRFLIVFEQSLCLLPVHHDRRSIWIPISYFIRI